LGRRTCPCRPWSPWGKRLAGGLGGAGRLRQLHVRRAPAQEAVRRGFRCLPTASHHPRPSRSLPFSCALVREQPPRPLVLDGYHFRLDYQQPYAARPVKIEERMNASHRSDGRVARRRLCVPLPACAPGPRECFVTWSVPLLVGAWIFRPAGSSGIFCPYAVRPAAEPPPVVSFPQGLLVHGAARTCCGVFLPANWSVPLVRACQRVLQLAVLSGAWMPRLKQLAGTGGGFSRAFPSLPPRSGHGPGSWHKGTLVSSGAGGGTCYEAAFPRRSFSRFLSRADNQTKAVDALAQQGLVVAGGRFAPRWTIWRLRRALLSLLCRRRLAGNGCVAPGLASDWWTWRLARGRPLGRQGGGVYRNGMCCLNARGDLTPGRLPEGVAPCYTPAQILGTIAVCFLLPCSPNPIFCNKTVLVSKK